MRVLAAMSGGVDSTLAAALLLEQGHEVLGGTLLLADLPPAGDPPDPERAAAALGIPFTRWDLRADFERLVVGGQSLADGRADAAAAAGDEGAFHGASVFAVFGRSTVAASRMTAARPSSRQRPAWLTENR